MMRSRKEGRDNAREAKNGEVAERNRYKVIPDQTSDSPAIERSSNTGVVLFSCMVFALVLLVVVIVSSAVMGRVCASAVVAGIIVGILAAMSVHIAQDWERIVVLRFGAFNRVSGPGLYWTIPFAEQNAMRVDMRIRSTTFAAEETLTNDLVPLDVDAVLFWMVFDAKAACLEVDDFGRAVKLAAQTALREAIGRLSAAQVAIKREQLDKEIKEALANRVDSWGVTVFSVEVRDILMPKELQDVMSMEAQAEQRMKGRLILAEGEADLSEMLINAGANYEDNEDALRLRTMHLLYESVRETGGTVVLPSSFSEGLGDVLPESAKKKLQ